MPMEIRMSNQTKYCLTAIICTLTASLILAAAYLVANRYQPSGPYDLIILDKWTGQTTTDTTAAKNQRWSVDKTR